MAAMMHAFDTLHTMHPHPRHRQKSCFIETHVEIYEPWHACWTHAIRTWHLCDTHVYDTDYYMRPHACHMRATYVDAVSYTHLTLPTSDLV